MAGLSDKERENLVAYLDGELDEASSRALETHLTLDPQAQAEALALRKTWELLDYLPRPEPSPRFTHKTLERVAGLQLAGAGTPRRWPAWFRVAVWTAVLLLAAGGSFAAVSFLASPSGSGSGTGADRQPDPEAGISRKEIKKQVAENLRLLDERLDENSLDVHLLFDVLERYADWLDRLTPPERRQIQEADDGKKRLELILTIRQRQWLENLPQADRQRLAGASGPEKEKTLKQLHERERERRREWAYAFQHWDELQRRRPAPRLDDVPGIKTYIKEYLEPRLSPEEKKRLDQAADKPQQLPRVLVELADKHPPALKGARGPMTWEGLPQEVRTRIDAALKKLRPKMAETLRQRLKEYEGQWPRYGTWVAQVAHQRGVVLPFELWPANNQDLSEPVQKFLREKLIPVLEPAETQRLNQFRGRWPRFPETIEQLAKKHGLPVPWFTLPPSRDHWDVYRPLPREVPAARAAQAKALPDVPRQALLLFYMIELPRAERESLHFFREDPAKWDRLRVLYFEKNPEELNKLREAEQRNRPNKGKKSKVP